MLRDTRITFHLVHIVDQNRFIAYNMHSIPRCQFHDSPKAQEREIRGNTSAVALGVVYSF